MQISTVIQNVTNRGKAVSLLNLSLMLVIALMLSGCLAHNPHRHGTHHPRTEIIFNYHYYPDVHVYYDTHRRLYHYHDKYRGWITVRILPSHIHLGRHRHHIVNSKHNKPWKLKHRNKRPHSHVAPSRYRPDNDRHRPDNDRHRPNNGQHRPNNDQHRPNNGQHRPNNDQHRPNNDQHRPNNGQHRPNNDQHRPNNDQHRPNNDQHRPNNDQHRPNNGQGHSQQRPNQNQHYRPIPKPVQKPSHDEQRRWRQKKQSGVLTPRQTVPHKHQRKEQKFIKQEDKDNQSHNDGR